MCACAKASGRVRERVRGSTLQHAAQHTAARCDARAATHCYTLQHIDPRRAVASRE